MEFILLMGPHKQSSLQEYTFNLGLKELPEINTKEELTVTTTYPLREHNFQNISVTQFPHVTNANDNSNYKKKSYKKTKPQKSQIY